jgi:cytochrome P450
MTPSIGSDPLDPDFDSESIDGVSGHLSAFFDDPSRYEDPFALFRRLRTLEPVHWSGHHTWVVTGHPEAREILYHPSLGRQASAEQQFGRLADPADSSEWQRSVAILLASMINRDPPDHTRLRRLVSRAFTPRAMTSWGPRIDQRVGELVDEVARADEFDFLHDLAYPLPQTIICELLGVPVNDLREMTTAIGSSKVMTVRGDDPEVASANDQRRSTVSQLADQVDYFQKLIERRKRDPGDDLISALAAVEDEGERLSMDELIGTVIILIGAGHETTANLVTNGMLALIRNPDVYDRVRSNDELMPLLLEELLRYSSPSPGQPRTALEPLEIAGRSISAGEQVFVILNAANRDPRVFAEPERFDIDRQNNTDSVTFTVGIHHCLGSALARLETVALFRTIFERLRPLELVSDDLRWKPSYVRGLTGLPVRQATQN